MGKLVADLCRRQGGAVSRAQLNALGVDDDRIRRLTAAGWLVRERQGVYRIGTLTDDGVLWAAYLAMGPGASLTHRTAGREHAVLRGHLAARPGMVVDVTAPTRRTARRGIRPHRARLDPRDVRVRRGLRFTTIARTLLDLAADLSEPELQAAVDEARVLRRLHRPSIGEFERRAIGFLRDYDFPPYVRNYAVQVDGEPFALDVVWTEERVGLEFDSRGFHDNDPKFASDRRRSRRLGAAGWHVVRATWIDLDDRPAELAADIWALLRAARVA